MLLLEQILRDFGNMLLALSADLKDVFLNASYQIEAVDKCFSVVACAST